MPEELDGVVMFFTVWFVVAVVVIAIAFVMYGIKQKGVSGATADIVDATIGTVKRKRAVTKQKTSRKPSSKRVDKFEFVTMRDYSDAITGLSEGLGYGKRIAQKAVDKAIEENQKEMDLDELVEESLRRLDGV